MRSIAIKKGLREGREALRDSFRLIAKFLPAFAAIVAVLSVLPALLQATLYINQNKPLLTAWGVWTQNFVNGRNGADESLSLIMNTAQRLPAIGSGSGLLELLVSFILVPLLFSSVTLLLNSQDFPSNGRASVSAVQKALSMAKHLLTVAFMSMVARSFLDLLPSIAMNLFSFVLSILSFLPFIGSLVTVLSVILSFVVSILSDILISSILCYVWVCAVSEGQAGFAAISRSFILFRANMPKTIGALSLWTVSKGVIKIVAAALWAFAGSATANLSALVYCFYIVNALFIGWHAALAVSLYQKREEGPASTGPSQGTRPNLDQMKRANIE